MNFWNYIVGDGNNSHKDLRKVTADVKESSDGIDSAIYMSKSIIAHYSIEAKKYDLERDRNYKDAMKNKGAGDIAQAEKYLSNSIKNDKMAKTVFAKINKYKNDIDFRLIPLKGELREAGILIEHATIYKQNPSSVLADVMTNAINIVEKTKEVMANNNHDHIRVLNTHFDDEANRMKIENDISYEDVKDEVEEHNCMEELIRECSQEMKDKYDNYVKSPEVETVEPSQL